ncbi:MAG TPA: sensor histidine kinase [Nitrososphaeraceae archaeon]|nr:sensor histidine kinase [Nitrososphaeraceae archaeon]
MTFKKYYSIFPLDTKKITILSIILIIGISYGLFFYFQNNTENNIRNSLFNEQKQRQMDATEALSHHISSDLDSIMARLQMLANSAVLQEGELSGNETTKLLQEVYNQINSITPTDRLFILNKDNIATINIIPKGEKSFVGINFSYREWVKQTKDTLMPVFSNGFEGMDGKYRIALAYPIVNKNTGQYLGLVGAAIPTISFFEHYGNIYNIKSQYLAVLDRNSVQLIHPIKSFIGTPFFGSHTQEVTGHNTILNSLIRRVLSGKQDFDIYEFKNGERLNTGNPIFVAGKPIYFVFVITPTSTIYSQINDVISVQRLQTFSLLAGITTAVVILIVFLINWNSSLDREVKRRIKELDESNKQLVLANKKLESANEQLKVHDNMQNEFINIAAHELRTPIQPILLLSDDLKSKIKDNEQLTLIDVISRNAKRLRRLTEDILDVTRIESKSLKLHKEQFNLNDVIVNTIDDIKINRYFNNKKNDIKILYDSDKDIFVKADKERLSQVIFNLLSNAIKFTSGEGGNISIISEKKDNQLIVSIKDTGSGIDPDILPRLFSKFVTKSFEGTGLGLFISKSIIEAHGGKIWAGNNSNGKGATFSFILPAA